MGVRRERRASFIITTPSRCAWAPGSSRQWPPASCSPSGALGRCAAIGSAPRSCRSLFRTFSAPYPRPQVPCRWRSASAASPQVQVSAVAAVSMALAWALELRVTALLTPGRQPYCGPLSPAADPSAVPITPTAPMASMGMVVEAAGALRRHCEPVVELRGLSEFGCVGRPCDDVMVRRSVWPRSHSCEAARGVICVSGMSLVVYDAAARKHCVRDSNIFT